MTADVTLLVVVLLIAFAFSAHPSPALSRARRVLVLGVGLLLLLAFLRRFQALLPPFVVPLVLAYLLDPVLDRLEARGMSRVRAILVVYGAVLTLLILALLVIVPPVTRQVEAVVAAAGSLNADSLPSSLTRQDQLIKGIAKTALDAGLKPAWVAQLQDNLALYDVDRVLAKSLAWLANQLNNTARWLAAQVSGLLWLLLLPITLFYCLRDFDPLRRRLYYLVPPERRDEVAVLASSINRTVGGYLRGYAMLSLAVGAVQTTVLFVLTPLFDFRYALILGLLAGVTYVVPFIGSLVATFLTAIVIFFTGGHSIAEAAIAWAILQGVNSLFDNLIQPRVIGQQVGLHPLLVMFALLAGGAAFGILGVLLAAPATACVKIVLEHFFPRLSEPIPEDQTPEAARERQATAEESPAADVEERKEPDDER